MTIQINTPVLPIAMPTLSYAVSSRIGTSHEAAGSPCQDAVLVREGLCGDVPYIVAVVADGAGSARFASEASQFAVEQIACFVQSEISGWGLDGLDDLLIDAAFSVHRMLQRRAKERAVSTDDFATTVLACIVTPDITAVIQIGDGGIVVGPPWRLMFRPRHGEYRNESTFVTDADAFERVSTALIKQPIQTITLFTDGLEDLLLSPGTFVVHPPLFETLAAKLANRTEPGEHPDLSDEINTLLGGDAVRSRTDDDTAIVTIRLEPAPS